MRPFAYRRASTIAEAVSEKSRRGEEQAFLAGGTTLIDLVKLDVMRPDALIDVNRLPLASIDREADGGLRIGANVRNSDLAAHAAVRSEYAVLSQAILSGASPQLRNMATTAGNLMQRVRCPYFRDNVSPCSKREPDTGCAAIDGYNRMHAVLGASESCVATHPSDLCVALAALDASVVVVGPSGERCMRFSDFHLLPGDRPHLEHALERDELIVAVQLPPMPAGARSLYLKLRDRASYEFALASVAVVAEVADGVFRDCRIALGGVATKPWRAGEAERVARGAPATEKTFQAIAEAALSEAKPLRHNAFKIPLAKRAIARALQQVVQ